MKRIIRLTESDLTRIVKRILKESDENDFYLLKANENQLERLKNISFDLPLDQEKYTDESNWITSKNFDVLATDGLEMQNLKSYPIFRKKEIRNHPTDYIYLTWNKKRNELNMSSSHNGPENFYEFEGPFKGDETHRYIMHFGLPTPE